MVPCWLGDWLRCNCWTACKGQGSVGFLIISLPWKNSLISFRRRSTAEWASWSESVAYILLPKVPCSCLLHNTGVFRWKHEGDRFCRLRSRAVNGYPGIRVPAGNGTTRVMKMLHPLNGYPGTRRVLVSGYPGSKMCTRNSSTEKIATKPSIQFRRD